MKLNILGTEYTLTMATEKEDAALYGSEGYCDRWEKTISIDSTTHSDELDSTDEPERVLQYTVRHEIIHAYLWESGLREYTEDEKLVNWIAIQFPKLLKTFQDADAL